MLLDTEQILLADHMFGRDVESQVNEPLAIKNGVFALLDALDNKKYTIELKLVHALLEREVKATLAILDSFNVKFIVLKGWAVSSSLYEKPYKRPKTDIDILVKGVDRSVVYSILENFGYYNPRGWIPSEISDQFTMKKKVKFDIFLTIDIHFQVSNDRNIQRILTVDSIFKNSNYLTELNCLIPNNYYLLLHAVLHLLNHYSYGDYVKLIWLYDIYLIIQASKEEELDEIASLSNNLHINSLLLFVLNELACHFPNSKNLSFLKEKAIDTKLYKEDIAISYLTKRNTFFKRFILNLQSTPTLKRKAIFVKETIFPSVQEIKIEGSKHKVLIPYLYIRRIIKGLINKAK